MEKKVKTTIIIFVSSLLIGISTGLVFLNYEIGPPDTYSHHYEVWLNSNSTSPFTILCPIPLDYYGNGYPNFLQEMEVTKGNATLAIEEMNAINSSVDGMYLSITGTGEIKVEWGAFWASKLGSRYWKISGIETIQPSEPSPYENYGIWVNSSIALESFRFYFGTESVDRELFTLGGGTGYSYEVNITQLSTGFHLIPIEYGAWVGN